MGIGLDAILDITIEMVELFGHRSGLAVLGDEIALTVLEVVNLMDGADHCGRSAGSGFIEFAEFFFGDGAHFHFETKVFGQLLEGTVGDGRKNGR